EDRALRADLVHHRAQVGDPLLEGGGPRAAIGEAGAAPIEEEDATELSHPAQKAGEGGVPPRHLDVRQPAEGEHDVARSLAGTLVGDADAAGVGPAGSRRRAGAGPPRRRTGRAAAALRAAGEPLSALHRRGDESERAGPHLLERLVPLPLLELLQRLE